MKNFLSLCGSTLFFAIGFWAASYCCFTSPLYISEALTSAPEEYEMQLTEDSGWWKTISEQNTKFWSDVESESAYEVKVYDRAFTVMAAGCFFFTLGLMVVYLPIKAFFTFKGMPTKLAKSKLRSSSLIQLGMIIISGPVVYFIFHGILGFYAEESWIGWFIEILVNTVELYMEPLLWLFHRFIVAVSFGSAVGVLYRYVIIRRFIIQEEGYTNP